MKYSILIIVIAFFAANISLANSPVKSNTNTQNLVSTNNAEETKVKTIHLTNETFKKLVFNYDKYKEWKYAGTTPCIIDFYADWCGPCKRIAPILEELAQEYEGEVIIYKVNTEQERELAGAFGISSIPALLFVPVNGQPQMAQGALQKESFIEAIENVLLVKKK